MQPTPAIRPGLLSHCRITPHFTRSPRHTSLISSSSTLLVSSEQTTHASIEAAVAKMVVDWVVSRGIDSGTLPVQAGYVREKKNFAILSPWEKRGNGSWKGGFPVRGLQYCLDSALSRPLVRMRLMRQCRQAVCRFPMPTSDQDCTYHICRLTNREFR